MTGLTYSLTPSAPDWVSARLPMPPNEQRKAPAIRKINKALTARETDSGAGGVTCPPQKFEQTVQNLLSMPHRPHRAGEKTKGATSKGSPQGRKDSGK